MPRINSLFSGRKKLQGISSFKSCKSYWFDMVDGMVHTGASFALQIGRPDDILTEQRAFSLLINRYMGDAYVRYGEKLRK